MTNRELYDRQMKMLASFLANGAITKAQYDKSASALTEKMLGKKNEKPSRKSEK